MKRSFPAAPGLASALAALVLVGCGSSPRAPESAAPEVPPASAPPSDATVPRGKVAGTHPAALVYLPAQGETLQAIAQRLLGDANQAWVIAQANGELAQARAGQPLIVPRTAPSPLGVSPEGMQTVPVLCYHRFTDADSARGNKMLMPASRFEAQLQWLAREGFSVLRMAELQDFLEGRRATPPKAVVITVDDGWASFYRHAFPLLQKYRVPVTLFVYTDIIGTRDGLSWAQLREMAQSGLVDIQAHSKTHRNLTERQAGETEVMWKRSLLNELRQPRQVLEKQLADSGVKVQYLAYPFGDANEGVLQTLAAEPYSLAFTVRAGGNAFYAPAQLLRRTMIFGDHSLEEFASRVQTRRPLSRP